ncbi:MAG: hypothetical protein IT320_20895 [Anaerolineae bacterium]|nr:hypothetical protein [Anaerolineae bacterium]
MPDFTYMIEVDWGRNATFGHASADITDYVESFTCGHGMTAPGQNFAAPAQATIALRDPDSDFLVGRFLGGAFSQLLKRGLLVRIRMTDGVTTWVLWQGKLDEVQYPSVNRQDAPGEGVGVTLTCRDAMLELLDAEYSPTLLLDASIGEALTDIFDSGVVQWPYPAFTLDVSELDGSDTLFENTFCNFDTGYTTIAFLGDNADAGRGVSAQQYARQLIDAEIMGRFWWDAPTGKFKFLDRLHDLTVSTSQLITIPGNVIEAPLSYAAQLANVINISYQPRRIGADNTVLFTLQSLPYRLQPGESRVLTARYATEEGVKVGALEIVPPLPTVDYAAVYYDDGTTLSRGDTAGSNAIDATNDVYVGFEHGASSAKLTIVNRGVHEVYLTTLQLRGTPLETFSTMTATANNPQSIYDYGRVEKTINIRLLDDDALAQGAANLLAAKWGDPVERVDRLSYIVTPATKTYLSLDVGERITVQQLTPVARYYDADHIVVGIRHSVNASARQHRVDLILDLTQRLSYFILNTSELAPSGANTEAVLAL